MYIGFSSKNLAYISLGALGLLLFYLFILNAINKKKKDLLREKEICFDDTFNKSAIGMALVNIEGRIIRTNQALCEMLGYSDEELRMRSFRDVTHPDDIESDINNVKKLLSGKADSIQMEKRFIHKQGHIIWAILNFSLISDRNGKPKYFISQVQNITNTKVMENKLMNSNLQYEILLNSYDNFIAIIDEKMRYVVVNQYVVDRINELVGMNYKIDDILGYSITEINPDIEYTEIYKTYEYVMKNRATKIIVSHLTKPNGEVNWYQYQVIPVTEGILVISTDITEMKKLEEIKEQAAENEIMLKETIEMDKLRTEFFSNLSHEFRTPLNIILNTNKMLYKLTDKENGKIKERKLKYLEISKQNCYRLIRLVNNIIDITKIDAGYMFLNLQYHDIVSLVEDIVKSVLDYAKNKDIDVDIIFDTDIEEKCILCDADGIERIMLNLLSNAIKFTEQKGKIEVRVSDKNENIEIVVKDNGIGIPENDLELIFERFQQVDKSLTRNHEGSGIGLSLVKALVEMHKGSIKVTSEAGEGTTFIVILPASIDEHCSADSHRIEVDDSRAERVFMEFSDIYY